MPLTGKIGSSLSFTPSGFETGKRSIVILHGGGGHDGCLELLLFVNPVGTLADRCAIDVKKARLDNGGDRVLFQESGELGRK